MSTFECTRESEIVEIIAEGRWPDGCSEDLHTHVAGCEVCFDLAAVANAIRAESDLAMREAQVPSSGVVWWRAQRRAQQEASRAASRAMMLVQLATIGGTAVLVLTILGGISMMRQDWSRWLTRAWYAAADLFAPSVAQWSMPIVFGVAMCVMLVPFAIYYAVAE